MAIPNNNQKITAKSKESGKVEMIGFEMVE
jgi:hypothetical protein